MLWLNGMSMVVQVIGSLLPSFSTQRFKGQGKEVMKKVSHASATCNITGAYIIKFGISAGSRPVITQSQWLFPNDHSCPLKTDCCLSFSVFLYQDSNLWSASWLALPQLVYFCDSVLASETSAQSWILSVLRLTSSVSTLVYKAWATVRRNCKVITGCKSTKWAQSTEWDCTCTMGMSFFGERGRGGKIAPCRKEFLNGTAPVWNQRLIFWSSLDQDQWTPRMLWGYNGEDSLKKICHTPQPPVVIRKNVRFFFSGT